MAKLDQLEHEKAPQVAARNFPTTSTSVALTQPRSASRTDLTAHKRNHPPSHSLRGSNPSTLLIVLELVVHEAMSGCETMGELVHSTRALRAELAESGCLSISFRECVWSSYCFEIVAWEQCCRRRLGCCGTRLTFGRNSTWSGQKKKCVSILEPGHP